MLGKCRCLCCGQPLSVDLDQKVLEFLEDERNEASQVSNQLLKQGHIREMSDPAYKPPLCFRIVLRLQQVV